MFSITEFGEMLEHVNKIRKVHDLKTGHIEVVGSSDLCTTLDEYLEDYCKSKSINYDKSHAIDKLSKDWDDEEAHGGVILKHDPVSGYIQVGKDIQIHYVCHSDFDAQTSRTVLLSCSNTPEAKKEMNDLISEVNKWKISRLKTFSKTHMIEVDSSYTYKLIGTPKTSWDDVLVPGALKESLRQSVEGFFKSKDVYSKLGLSWQRGLLLIGPPGNGKTMICKAVASEVKVPFIIAKLDAKSGDGEITYAFNIAREISPAILCLEDVDRLFDPKLGGGRASLTYFLNLLDGINKKNDGILILSTANHPEYIDHALVNRPSRFDRIFKVETPTLECRKQFLQKIRGTAKFSDEALTIVAEETDKLPMVFIKEIITQANLTAVYNGKSEPDDTDLRDALKSLKSQYKEGKRDFQKNTTIKAFGSNEDED